MPIYPTERSEIITRIRRPISLKNVARWSCKIMLLLLAIATIALWLAMLAERLS